MLPKQAEKVVASQMMLPKGIKNGSLVMVNCFFKRERVDVTEDFGEVRFLRFEDVRGIHQSLIGSLRYGFISSSVTGPDLCFLQ